MTRGAVSQWLKLYRKRPCRRCFQRKPRLRLPPITLDKTITMYYSNPMRRVFKTKTFARWMRKTLLRDPALLKAVDEMESGLIDADLGGNTLEDKIYKKRIALPRRGKSGGVRTIVATRKAGHWFFMLGFEKNERDNISADELQMLRDLAQKLLLTTNQHLVEIMDNRELEEVLP